MSDEDPVSLWIEHLKFGNESAARKLWDHLALRLYAAARAKISGDTKRVYDEEDAAQSAYHALCVGVAAGRYPDLTDRKSLWRLLLVIVSRKITDRHRHDHREQRDVRRTEMESQSDESGFIHQLPAGAPPAELAVECVDLCADLFEKLEDPQLQRITWLKIEGYNDQEIANQLGCARRTIQRKVERIRRIWQELEDVSPAMSKNRAECR